MPNEPDPGAIRTLWTAESIAIVGASTRTGTPGQLAIEFLLRHGYAGRIIPVNPHATEVAGLRAYPTVREAGGAELALIVVPPAAVPGAVDDCAAAGVRLAIIGTSGFAETGEQGRAMQEDLIARAKSMRLVGPNCIGAVGFANGLVASFSPLFAGAQTTLHPGGIGFASASGALGFGAVSLALQRGMGFVAAVSTGNEADVTAIDVLNALAAEPDCTALLGYVESLRDGAGLRTLAATGKPTALLVAGTSSEGARAAASHTGALATSNRVVDGVLRQLGIKRVYDVEELLDVGDAYALCAGRPAGPRIAVVTTSGGAGILAADAVIAHGLVLAQLHPTTVQTLAQVVPAYGATANPVDVTATVMRDRTLVARALAAVAADPNVDQVVVCFCVLVGEDVDAVVDGLAAGVRDSGKPILVARTGADHLAPTAAAALRAAGVPTYPTPARAVRAAAALAHYRGRARLGVQPPATQPAEPPATPRAADQAVTPPAATDERGLKEWLAKYGIAVPAGQVVHDPKSARAAVESYGGLAVFKAVVPGLVHKTDAGAVALEVTPQTAEATFARLAALPAATGVLVEEQVPAGVELLVGLAPSPLGMVLTVGAGGVFTEALDDVAVRLLPVDALEVRDALDSTRIARLLYSSRAPAPDVDAFVALAVRVARLAAGLPSGAELDLNPVVVHTAGATVLDAALIVRDI